MTKLEWLDGRPVDTDQKHTCPECKERWQNYHKCPNTGHAYWYTQDRIQGFFIEDGSVRPLTAKEYEEANR